MTDAPNETVLRSRVPEAGAGQKLVAWLGSRFRYLDEAQWRVEIEAFRVTINGKAARADDRLRRGDEVAYRPVHEEPRANTAIEVLHDDPDFAVVFKPAHLVAHADGAFVQNTFFRALERRYQSRGEQPPVALAHRLDRETSGLMIATKRAAASRALQQQFAAGAVEKEYLAIVHGRVEADHFAVDGFLGRDPRSEITIRRAVATVGGNGAQPARTSFRVEERVGDFTLVRAFPETGRTHQIRAHLTHAGHSIVGDKLYGRTDADYIEYVRFVKSGGDPWWDGRLAAGRQLLHAAVIRFAHPTTGAPLSFASEMPEDMVQFLRNHRS